MALRASPKSSMRKSRKHKDDRRILKLIVAVLLVTCFVLLARQRPNSLTTMKSNIIYYASAAAATTTMDNNNNDEDEEAPNETEPSAAEQREENSGWKDIHVFYGDEKHLLRGRMAKSQVSQDDIVMGLLKNKTNGYFLDLAANDATQLSNTYRLEQELQWTGLCFEPNPRYWRRLTYRKCQIVAAVVGQTRMEEVKFKMHDGTPRAPSGGIEGFDNKANRPKSNDPAVPLYTVPLVEILERFKTPTHIDYLSLDVEGAEYFIMKDFPFDQYHFDVMTVERPSGELVDLLYQHGYRYVAGNNEWGQETLFVHSNVVPNLDFDVLDRVKWIKGDTKWIQVGPKFLDKPTVLGK